MTLQPLKVRDCHWIIVPGAADVRGQVNFLQRGKGLDFEPQRLFWLRRHAPDQRYGRRCHRAAQLVLIAMGGACRARLDDGSVEQTVTLGDPAHALHVAPMVWYELVDFAPDTVVTVIASIPYDAADELADRTVFKREMGERR